MFSDANNLAVQTPAYKTGVEPYDQFSTFAPGSAMDRVESMIGNTQRERISQKVASDLNIMRAKSADDAWANKAILAQKINQMRNNYQAVSSSRAADDAWAGKALMEYAIANPDKVDQGEMLRAIGGNYASQIKEEYSRPYQSAAYEINAYKTGRADSAWANAALAGAFNKVMDREQAINASRAADDAWAMKAAVDLVRRGH